MTDTRYLVLRREPSTDLTRQAWVEIADVLANNANTAIRMAVTDTNPANGSYVATPMRSWKPLTVTAETQTIIKFGEAS